jgi:hypothetical protein
MNPVKMMFDFDIFSQLAQEISIIRRVPQVPHQGRRNDRRRRDPPREPHQTLKKIAI